MKIETLALLLCPLISLALVAEKMKNEVITTTKTKEEQQALTPWQALEKLKAGNERFISGAMRQRNLAAQVASSAKQHPFAVILSCMDSRGSTELLFDQGIGDVFAQRLAGNVVNADVLGGMEFATKLVGAKLIVVMGHTKCGAIKGACDDAKLGHLTELLKKIKPAVKAVQKKDKKNTCDKEEAIDAMAEQNVRDMIAQIKKKSPVVMKLLKEGQVGMVGAMHDISTGKISFIEDVSLLPGAPLQKK